MKKAWDKFKKILFPKDYAKTTEDLPLWYKCLVPHDGSLPIMITKSKVMLPGGKEKTMETKVLKNKNRTWFESRFID